MLSVMRVLLVGILMTSPGLACAARTFGLVIGINNYAHVPTLDGARDDALDLSSALNRMGVEDVITLLDQDATKHNVVQAWQTLVSRARSGDVIFMSYAGHGAQAPERTCASPAGMRRSSPRAMPTARSATTPFSTSGVLVTRKPR